MKFWHRHVWKEIDRDSYHTSKKGLLTTIVTYQCDTCLKLKEKKQKSFTSSVQRPDKDEVC